MSWITVKDKSGNTYKITSEAFEARLKRQGFTRAGGVPAKNTPTPDTDSGTKTVKKQPKTVQK